MMTTPSPVFILNNGTQKMFCFSTVLVRSSSLLSTFFFLLNQIFVLLYQQTLRQRTTGGEKCFLKLSSNPCQEKLFYESFNSLSRSPSRLDCPAFPTLFSFHAIYDVIIHFIPGGKVVFAKPSGTELIEFVILFNPPPTRNAIGRKYFRWRGRKFQHRLDHRHRR